MDSIDDVVKDAAEQAAEAVVEGAADALADGSEDATDNATDDAQAPVVVTVVDGNDSASPGEALAFAGAVRAIAAEEATLAVAAAIDAHNAMVPHLTMGDVVGMLNQEPDEIMAPVEMTQDAVPVPAHPWFRSRSRR